MVAALLDFFGFFPSAVLLVLGAWLSEYGWRFVWILTILFAICTCIAFNSFHKANIKYELQQEMILQDIAISKKLLKSKKKQIVIKNADSDNDDINNNNVNNNNNDNSNKKKNIDNKNIKKSVKKKKRERVDDNEIDNDFSEDVALLDNEKSV